MNSHQLHPDFISDLRKRQEQARRALIVQLRAQEREGLEARDFVAQWTLNTDEIVLALVLEARSDALRGKSEAQQRYIESVEVVGLGGYGRKELFPKSDLDILFLLPEACPPREVQPFVDRVLYALWDLGFEVGHAVRTLSECTEIAQSDQSTKTSMIDARRIGVHLSNLFVGLQEMITCEFLTGRGAEVFMQQKLKEAQQRDSKFENTLYRLEPDLKSGAGGVRELHTALWVARARWRANSTDELLRIGVLSEREKSALGRASAFLWRCRIELHLNVNRRREMMGFESQETIAKVLGFRKSTENQESSSDEVSRGTERFMRAYYFHAQQMRSLCRRIIERATTHVRTRPATSSSIPGRFKVFDGMLTVSDHAQLQRDPRMLMRLFRVANDENLIIYSYSKDLIRSALLHFGKTHRRDPQVVTDFLTVLEDPSEGGKILQLMHRLGVLCRMIPEFARVTARWQHSLYHVYTVDVHSLFVVAEMKRLRNGDFVEALPGLTRRFMELPRPSVVYLAALLHDIGKGWRSGDHSVRGERVAKTVGQRLEEAATTAWTKEETEDLCWLVGEHLLMSDISQRRDLDDHDLIQTFAQECRSVERLTMLWALTVADMKATSPKVWSSWKSALLKELFEKARTELSHEGRSRPWDEHLAARRNQLAGQLHAEAARLFLSPLPERALQTFIQSLPDRYVVSVSKRKMLSHLTGLSRFQEQGELWMKRQDSPSRAIHELTFICKDHVGLLAQITGVLLAHQLDILSAQVFTLDVDAKQPLALDIIHVRDVAGEEFLSPARRQEIRLDLHAVLTGEKSVDALLESRLQSSTLDKKAKPHVPTKVSVARGHSRTDTVIDVFCADHLGALFTISSALADQGLSIRLAKISSQGGRVADGFYVTDANTGQKIANVQRLRSIVEGLRGAIAEKAEI